MSALIETPERLTDRSPHVGELVESALPALAGGGGGGGRRRPVRASPRVSLACADDDARGRPWRSTGISRSTAASSSRKRGARSAPGASTRPATSAPSCTPCAGTASPPPIRTSSSHRSGPASGSTPTRWSRSASAPHAPRQPLHRRRHRPRQDHRGRPNRPASSCFARRRGPSSPPRPRPSWSNGRPRWRSASASSS